MPPCTAFDRQCHRAAVPPVPPRAVSDRRAAAVSPRIAHNSPDVHTLHSMSCSRQSRQAGQFVITSICCSSTQRAAGRTGHRSSTVALIGTPTIWQQWSWSAQQLDLLAAAAATAPATTVTRLLHAGQQGGAAVRRRRSRRRCLHVGWRQGRHSQQRGGRAGAQGAPLQRSRHTQASRSSVLRPAAVCGCQLQVWSSVTTEPEWDHLHAEEVRACIVAEQHATRHAHNVDLPPRAPVGVCSCRSSRRSCAGRTPNTAWCWRLAQTGAACACCKGLRPAAASGSSSSRRSSSGQVRAGASQGSWRAGRAP